MGHTFTLGLDVDLNNVVTAIQCDHGAIPPAQKFTRARLVAWVKEQVSAGHTVRTVYECCGFGYTLHEQLTAAGRALAHHHADAALAGTAAQE